MGPLAAAGLGVLGGGILSGIMGGGKDPGSSKSRTEKVDTLSPEQSQFLKSLYGGGFDSNPLQQQSQNTLSQLMGNSVPNQKTFEKPYMTQFHEQVVPGIAERFAGVGGLSSSGFQQSLGQAGKGLSETLASLREQMLGQQKDRQANAATSAYQMSQGPLQARLQGLGAQPFAPVFHPGTPGLLGSILPGLAGGLGTGLGMGAGNKLFG